MTDNVLEFPPAPAPTEFLIGPFQGYRVVVEGRCIPGLTGFKDGDKIALVVDGRFSVSLSDGDARNVAWLLANAIAVAQGYPCLSSETRERPFAPLVMSIEPPA